jgi:photosystem II stability/assembly factor-like uncharacterized protein
LARFLDRLALAASTLIALASTASAGINQWTSVGPEGGDIIDVEITNTTPAVAYALTPAAVYRSNDMGQTWSQTAWVGHGTSSDLAVHPTQPDRVVIASGGRVLVSSNGGVTFYLLNPPGASTPLQRVAFSEDGAHLYASDRNTLYISSDFGATWTTGATVGPTDNSYILPFHVDPTNPDRVIARVEGGLSITIDAGAHWTHIDVPATFVADIAFDRSGGRIWAATPESLWYTSDNGASWTLSTLTTGVSTVAIHPTDASLMYAHDGASVYRSTDAGATWTRSNSGTLIPRTVNALAIDPHSRDRLLIATLTGVWSSADAGATWSHSSRGIVAGTPWFITSTPDRSYFAVRGQIYSLEWGANAAVALDSTALDQVLAFAFPYDYQYIYELHADRLPTGDRLFVGDAGNFARSLDGGQTWTRLSDPLVNNSSIYAVEVAPDNPNIVLTATDGLVARSIDGGDHWSTTSGIAEGEWISAIEFVSATVAYAFGPQKLYRTLDAGLSWSPVDLPVDPVESILSVLAHAQAIYVGTTMGVHRSDAGMSWTRLSVPHGGRLAADATGLYIAGEGVSRSVDGGNTWTGVFFLGGYATGLQLDPTAPGRLLKTTESQGAHTYTVATDLTVTAAGIPSTAPASGVRTEIWFTVTNGGPHTAASVTLNIDVAGGRALYQNADCSVNPSTPSHATCTLGAMPSGQSKLVRIESSFETAGPLSYTASVASVENELTAANNSLSQSWTYNAPSSSGGGGGGGGALSWWMLLALAGIAAERRRNIC